MYTLPVEGGLSRLLAIFSSHFPPVIGPVRSAREDDLSLLRQFGRPAFAYSGATTLLRPHIHGSRLVDLDVGRTSGTSATRAGPPPTTSTRTRGSCWPRRPREQGTRHRVPVRPAAAGRAGHPVGVGGLPSGLVHVHLVAGEGAVAGVGERDPGGHGHGARLSAATVVIQRTTVRTSRFLEYGSRPPYAESVGSGTAVVLRSGRAWTVHWSRPTWNTGTTFTAASGKPMTFAPGQIWVLLVSR